jgi:hypothetical protein
VLTREVIAGYSLLYTWPGTDPALLPTAFLAHLDVVPIAPGTEGQWTEPPFAGKIAGGFLWGRGVLDDKASLMGLMEAVERLATDGYRPKRTLLFAFGHDEEVGGKEGAKAISTALEARGVRLEAVFDDGQAVFNGNAGHAAVSRGARRSAEATKSMGYAELGIIRVHRAIPQSMSRTGGCRASFLVGGRYRLCKNDTRHPPRIRWGSLRAQCGTLRGPVRAVAAGPPHSQACSVGRARDHRLRLPRKASLRSPDYCGSCVFP